MICTFVDDLSQGIPIVFVRQVLRKLSMKTTWIDANFCSARQLKRLYRKLGLSDEFSCIVLEHFDIFQDGKT